MEIINHLSFDLNHRGVSQRIHATQHDANLRVVYCKILSNGADLSNIALFTPALAYKKSDGTSGLYDTLPNGDSAINIDGVASTIEVTLAEQVFTKPGLVKAAVVLRDDSLNQISTFPFDIWVEPNPSASGIVSNNYYNYQTLADINEAIQGIIDGTFSIATDSTLTAVQLPANAKATGDAIAALSVDLSAIDDSTAIVAEVTGNAITLNDASNRPLRGLTLYGKTTQNGTPTPDAPVEMVDVGASSSVGVSAMGKNMLQNTLAQATRNGVTFTVNEDGSIQTDGTASEDVYIEVGQAVLSAGVKYTLSGCPSGGSITAYTLYIGSKSLFDFGSGNSFTADGSVYAVWVKIASGCNASNLLFEPMIRLASVADETYEPYKPDKNITVSTQNGLPGLPVTSGGNYADESGQQWISDEVDLGRGVRVNRIAELVLTGMEIWTYSAASYANWAFSVCAQDAMAGTPVLCTHYVGVSGGSPAAGQISITAAGSVVIKADNIQSKEDVKTLLAAQYAAGTPVKVRYALAEPVETPLDADALTTYAALHTNKPNTTILNDAGACMKVAYVADTKAYIDNKFAALTAAIMNT